MNFTIESKYKDCFNVNYNPIYLNRYTDSISVINSIKNNESNNSCTIYFNFFSVYNNDLQSNIYSYIHNNVYINDTKTALLLRKLNSLKEEILFNNNIIYIRNIDDYIQKNLDLYALENFIIENFTNKCFIIIENTKCNSFLKNYIHIGADFYMKKMF